MSVDNIVKLVHKLKAGKHDGNNGLTSDCIINGPHKLYVYMSLLYKVMLMHCYIPKDLYVGTMFPLPKVKGLTCNSDKYRAITLSNCLLKLLDLIILSSQSSTLYTDALQFGFKQECSTSMCTTMLNEVCRMFVSKRSNVYTLLLDASKAFDRVHYIKLFELLINRGMNAMFIRFMLKLYTNQTLRINWQNTLSAEFHVTNGVRQGGVLSPVLFIVYIDELLQKLRHSGYGCYVGPHFLGALAYADDIVLISPTLSGLKSMANICEEFSIEFSILFNGSKSQYCVFHKGSHYGNTTVTFCNVILSECHVITHLGHKLYANVKVHDTDDIIAAFYRQYNVFQASFKGLPSAIQSDLFQKYCSSFYGCVLIPFNSCLRKVQITWRKSLRRVWRLSNRTHCSIVNCLGSTNCDLHMFVNRFLKLFLTMFNHKADVIRYMCRMSIFCSLSVLCENFLFCCQALDLEQDLLLAKSIHDISSLVKSYCFNYCKDVLSQCNAAVLKELCDARDKLTECILDSNEIQCIIDDICIN